MDIISTLIGRPDVTARFGITEACAASTMVGTPSELAQRAEPQKSKLAQRAKP